MFVTYLVSVIFYVKMLLFFDRKTSNTIWVNVDVVLE